MSFANIKYHTALANYFVAQPLFFDGELQKKPHIRKCMEQPWQQTKGKLWDEVTNTLCNLDFIQAKATAKMTYDLVNDFNAVLQVIPDNAENIYEENKRQARMDKYTRDLIAYAKGEITNLEIPETIRLWSKERIDVEILRMKTNPSRLDRLKDFINFLGQEAGNLQNYAFEFPYFVKQQAWNWADSGPVSNLAINQLANNYKSLLLRTLNNRPLWNVKTQILHILRANIDDMVTSVSMTPDNKLAISGSYKTCTLWDLFNGKPILTLTTHNNYISSIFITPDGKYAITGSEDNNCIYWDLSTGREIHILKGHTKPIKNVLITPNGSRAISSSYDKSCIVWNLITGKAIHTLIFPNLIRTVRICPDGQRAITILEVGLFIFWDINTADRYQTLKLDSGSYIFVSSDGKELFYKIEYAKIFWDIKDGNPSKILNGHTDKVADFSITPDGKRAISCSYDKTCILWDLLTGDIITVLKKHTGFIKHVIINANGTKAISGSDDHTCILWDLTIADHSQIIKLKDNPIYSISISPNSKWALSSSDDTTFICRYWNLVTGEELQSLVGHTDRIGIVNIAPNGQYAISGSSDKNCILWDLRSGEPRHVLKGHTDTVTSIAITADGARAISGSHDTNCIVWNLMTGKAIKLLRGHKERIRDVKITPDGGHGISASNDNNCILWDLKSGGVRHIMKGHKGVIFTVVITPDGKCAISGSEDKTCILWSLSSGEIIRVLEGHSDFISSVSITPDGQKVISGSFDTTCNMWNLKTGELIHTLKGHNDIVNSVSITPDGNRAISSGKLDRTCILWDLKTGKKISLFISDYSIWATSLINDGIVLGCDEGEFIILKTNKNIFTSSLPICTVQNQWDFERNAVQRHSTNCPLCGQRFAPPASIITTIEEITKKAGLRPDQSPCLELPDEAWEHPGLLSECPNCGEKLKFNPFIAGGDY